MKSKVGKLASVSTQVSNTTGTYRKALTHAKKHHKGIKTVLDYGAGIGKGADAIRSRVSRVETFEPYPAKWGSSKRVTYTKPGSIKKKYDLVLCLNVLNIVTQPTRKQIVKRVARLLKPGGIAIFTVRAYEGDIKETATCKRGSEKGSCVIRKTINGRGVDVYQKGFSQRELNNYIKLILGSSYEVKSIPEAIGGKGVMIKKKS